MWIIFASLFSLDFKRLCLTFQNQLEDSFQTAKLYLPEGCKARYACLPELQLLLTALQINYICKQIILKAVVFKLGRCFYMCSYIFCCSWLTGAFEQEYLLQIWFQIFRQTKFSFFLSSTKRKEGKKPQNLFQYFLRSSLL